MLTRDEDCSHWCLQSKKKKKKRKKFKKLNSEVFLALTENTCDFQATQTIRLSLTPTGGASDPCSIGTRPTSHFASVTVGHWYRGRGPRRAGQGAVRMALGQTRAGKQAAICVHLSRG